MTFNLMNLFAGAPSLIDRVTTAVRRDRNRVSGGLAGVRPGQSPPGRGLWRERVRIQSIRPSDLSRHLRRDIGLEL